MIFSTFGFICVYLVIVFLLYNVSLKRDQPTLAKVVLIIASFIFYAIGSGAFFPVFVASIFVNFLFGQQMAKQETVSRKRRILIVGVLLNVALLAYYKYTNFVIFNLNLFIEVPVAYQNIVLPIGISFFTFQLVGFLVDSYKGETKNYNILDYLLFITFFPQLVVGPIVHHKDVVPQYQRLSRHTLSAERIAPGLFLFAIGCTKKLVMADPMTIWAQNAFDHAQSLNMVESWVASTTYTMSYYFDLSGYADMAIGLGMIFGITLPANFNSPYKARNFADYWRRWHITLSKFLGDYVFRSVYRKGAGNGNFYRALFITFLVSGLWHGAGWTFVVWGIVNGVFVIASHAMRIHRIQLPIAIAWLLTFAGVVGTRTLFVSDSFADASYVLRQFVNVSDFTLTGNDFVTMQQAVYLLLSFVLVLGFRNSREIVEDFRPNTRFALATVGLMLLSFFNMSYVRGFLYFQF